MRAFAVARWGLALALLLGCKTYKDQVQTLPPGYEAGVYTPPPDRQVYDDGGLIRGGAGGQGGNGVVINNDGGGSPSAPDGATGGNLVDLGGGSSFDSGRADGGSCDLLMQSCGPQMGCYPSAAGLGRCMPTDPGFAEGVQCAEASNCAPGLSCINALCTALCSTAQPNCTAGRRCVALPATDGVGYCMP